MAFKTGDLLFYNNEPCEFVAPLNDNESVVILRGWVEGEYGDSELVEQLIPVFTKRLSTTKLKLSDEFRKQELEMLARVRERKSEIEKEIGALEQKRKELARSAAKYGALEQVIDLIEGRLQWAVVEGYSSYSIHRLEDLRCSYDKNELALLSYRRRNKAEFEAFVGSYSDNSGSHNKATFFFTEDEAISFLRAKLEDRALSDRNYISEELVLRCGGVDRFSDTVKMRLEQQRKASEERKQKDIAEAEKRLQEIRSRAI